MYLTWYICTLSAHILFYRARFPSLKSKFGVIEAATQSHNGSSEKPVSAFTLVVVLYDAYMGVYGLLEEFSTLCVVRADLSPLSGSAQPKQGKNGKVHIFNTPFTPCLTRTNCSKRRIGQSCFLSRFISVSPSSERESNGWIM
jgi:hypothetical protein